MFHCTIVNIAHHLIPDSPIGYVECPFQLVRGDHGVFEHRFDRLQSSHRGIKSESILHYSVGSSRSILLQRLDTASAKIIADGSTDYSLLWIGEDDSTDTSF